MTNELKWYKSVCVMRTFIRACHGKIDEVRKAQEELQEMAAGLQKKNVIMRNELRHLKRTVGDDTQKPNRSPVRGYETRSPSRGRGSAARGAPDERWGHTRLYGLLYVATICFENGALSSPELLWGVRSCSQARRKLI